MTGRRMGPPDAEVRLRLLDATERVLAAKGYPGVTSRNVAQEAGVDQKLVFYYFRNMEELVVATFRRRSETFLGRLAELARSENPICDLWVLSSDRSGRLIIEFMAMATRNEALRQEVAAYSRQANSIINQVLARAVTSTPLASSGADAAFVNFAIASLARNLILESELGLLDSENDIRSVIERVLHELGSSTRAS
jgi:AcrR family transcriptional regulator